MQTEQTGTRASEQDSTNGAQTRGFLLGSDYVVTKLTPLEVEKLWSVLRGSVESALAYAYGELAADDILMKILADKMQLWIVQSKTETVPYGVVTTEVVDYARLAALRIITIGGIFMDRWARPLNEALVKFCKEQHCSRMEAYGRKGLAKKLAPLAFQPAYTAYIKEVS